jgi:outer membrane protein assembly factor BamB
MHRRLGFTFFLALCVVALSLPVFANAENETLFDAARSGDLSLVKKLIEEQGVDVNSKTKYGATALAYASDKGHQEIVAFLLSKGADVNTVDTFYNASPLAWAGMGDRVEVVRMLVENGATGSSSMLPGAVRDKNEAMVAAVLAATDLEPDAVINALAQAKEMEGGEAIVKLLEAVEIDVVETPAIEIDAETMATFVGQYRSEEIGMTIEVRLEEGALVGQATGQPPISLRPIGESRFESVDVAGIEMEFAGRGGIIEQLVLNQGGQTIPFARVDAKVDEAEVAEATEVEAAEPELAPLPAAKRSAARNWPSFRGNSADGNGDGQGAPTDWNVESGDSVLWKTPIAGLANSSPIVWKDRVFVTTAISAANDDTFRAGLYGDVDSVEDLSEHTFKMMALKLGSGEVLWEKSVASSVPGAKRHLKSTQANSTPVTDGKRVVALFGTIGLLVAYDLDGEELWRTDIGVLDAGWFYDETYQWGHASSPILYDGLVIVQADIYKNSFIAAYSAKDGKLKWKTDRDAVPSWGTPTVYRGERDELVTNGNVVRGYDPKTGKELWSLGPNSEVTVATPIIGDGLIYVTGGYPPARPVYALKPGGSGALQADDEENNIAWHHERGGTYMPTPLVYNGRLFTCNNDGRMIVYDAKSGEQIYRARVGGGGGTFTGSPIAADGRIYFGTEEGDVFVIRADTDEYVELAHNEMDEIIMTTPAISDGVLVLRTMKHLYGLGAKKADK